MLLSLFVLNTCKKDVQYANLIGTITDEVTNNPIANATVEVASKTANTGDDGKFKLTDIVPSNYEISITKSDYKPIVNKSIALIVGDNTPIFKMQQLLSVIPQNLTFQNNESEKTLQLTYIQTS